MTDYETGISREAQEAAARILRQVADEARADAAIEMRQAQINTLAEQLDPLLTNPTANRKRIEEIRAKLRALDW